MNLAPWTISYSCYPSRYRRVLLEIGQRGFVSSCLVFLLVIKNWSCRPLEIGQYSWRVDKEVSLVHVCSFCQTISVVVATVIWIVLFRSTWLNSWRFEVVEAWPNLYIIELESAMLLVPYLICWREQFDSVRQWFGSCGCSSATSMLRILLGLSNWNGLTVRSYFFAIDNLLKLLIDNLHSKHCVMLASNSQFLQIWHTSRKSILMDMNAWLRLTRLIHLLPMFCMFFCCWPAFSNMVDFVHCRPSW